MNTEIWKEEILNQYIANQIQENLTLEYKAADAISKSDGPIKEISKDVSAMANSQGGTIIYGIKEFDEKEKRHLTEKIDPVNQKVYTKEWLEQIITSNIRPKIQGLVIHSVQIESNLNNSVFVVEIPQSNTAHQAKDFRYYKRHNFKSEPMEDYEIRDIMNRTNVPNVSVKFGLYSGVFEAETNNFVPYRGLRVIIRNEGAKVINKLKINIEMTNLGWYDDLDEFKNNSMLELGRGDDKNINVTKRGNLNSFVDLIFVYQSEYVIFPQEEIDIGEKIGWGYLEPVQVAVVGKWREFANDANWEIKWKLLADNMPFIEGIEKVSELPEMPPYTS